MNTEQIEYRYNNDPKIHNLVKALESFITVYGFSPAEVCEAADFAATIILKSCPFHYKYQDR